MKDIRHAVDKHIVALHLRARVLFGVGANNVAGSLFVPVRSAPLRGVCGGLGRDVLSGIVSNPKYLPRPWHRAIGKMVSIFPANTLMRARLEGGQRPGPLSSHCRAASILFSPLPPLVAGYQPIVHRRYRHFQVPVVGVGQYSFMQNMPECSLGVFF